MYTVSDELLCIMQMKKKTTKTRTVKPSGPDGYNNKAKGAVGKEENGKWIEGDKREVGQRRREEKEGEREEELKGYYSEDSSMNVVLEIIKR